MAVTAVMLTDVSAQGGAVTLAQLREAHLPFYRGRPDLDALASRVPRSFFVPGDFQEDTWT
eukprot:7469668-Pyramimonas_sp.AAC.1